MQRIATALRAANAAKHGAHNTARPIALAQAPLSAPARSASSRALGEKALTHCRTWTQDKILEAAHRSQSSASYKRDNWTTCKAGDVPDNIWIQTIVSPKNLAPSLRGKTPEEIRDFLQKVDAGEAPLPPGSSNYFTTSTAHAKAGGAACPFSIDHYKKDRGLNAVTQVSVLNDKGLPRGTERIINPVTQKEHLVIPSAADALRQFMAIHDVSNSLPGFMDLPVAISYTTENESKIVNIEHKEPTTEQEHSDLLAMREFYDSHQMTYEIEKSRKNPGHITIAVREPIGPGGVLQIYVPLSYLFLIHPTCLGFQSHEGFYRRKSDGTLILPQYMDINRPQPTICLGPTPSEAPKDINEMRTAPAKTKLPLMDERQSNGNPHDKSKHHGQSDTRHEKHYDKHPHVSHHKHHDKQRSNERHVSKATKQKWKTLGMFVGATTALTGLFKIASMASSGATQSKKTPGSKKPAYK